MGLRCDIEPESELRSSADRRVYQHVVEYSCIGGKLHVCGVGFREGTGFIWWMQEQLVC